MRTFDWEQLPHFLAVARAGSLRAAAQLSGANYGTVNRGIQALEARYWARLFHRSKRGFTLTEVGEALLPLAEEAEQKIIAARKRVEGLDRSEVGKIRFSLTPTIAYDLIAPILAAFSARYPEIDIEVRLTAEVESITNDETDVSLRAARDVTDDVVARKLFPLQLAAYASQNYLASAFTRAGADGEGLTWIGSPDNDGIKSFLAQSAFPKATLRHVVADGYMRAQLVSLGTGLSHLPVLFEQTHPDLRRVPGTEVFSGPSLWILLHSDLRKTVRVRRFVDFLAAELLKLNKA